MATAEANIQNKIRKGKKSSEENLEDYVEILDENADAERKNSEAEQIKLSSEEDLESLLKLAEELKEKIERAKKNIVIILLRIIQGISLLGFIYSVVMTYLILKSFTIPESDKFGLIGIIIFSVITPFAAQILIKKEKEKTVPDKLALKEVLQLLREVHGTIAEREDWSILKRAEFRIRLSRFNLNEEKLKSAFRFFS